MDTNKSKYDTNPLDPDYPKQTQDGLDEGADGPDTQRIGARTKGIGVEVDQAPRNNVYSEAPTRRYDNFSVNASYPSVFVPPPTAPPISPPPAHAYRPGVQRPTSRSVPGVGLPENWALMLPYAPFYIGVVASLIELFLVPRQEAKVRFHAAQGLALHAAILAVQTLFGIIGLVTDFSIGGKLFGVAALVFLIISMVRVWKGEPHYIAPLSEPAQWFNEHIEPRKKS